MQGALLFRATYAMEFTLFHIQPNFYVPPHRKHYCLQYYNNRSNRCCQAQKVFPLLVFLPLQIVFIKIVKGKLYKTFSIISIRTFIPIL